METRGPAHTNMGARCCRPNAGLADVELGRDFSYEGQTFPAKVVDIYDGDTCRIAFRDAGQIRQWRARMAGYDSPEMRPPKAQPNRDAEIAAACRAKEALASRVGGRVVTVTAGKFDKYGRLLVTVRVGGTDVNAWMVAAGHGRPYDGGKKAAFDDPPPP